jgi:hypothetical protein
MKRNNVCSNVYVSKLHMYVYLQITLENAGIGYKENLDLDI